MSPTGVRLPGNEEASRRYLLLALLIILANTLCHLCFIGMGPLDLFPDEAHYWDWSRHLDISYYSKGPLVAYVIFAFTALFGTSAFAVRLGAVVLSVGSGFLIFYMGKVFFRSEKVGFYAVAMVFLMPLLNAGTFIMTIDAPFVFFWVLGVLAGYSAFQGKKCWWYVLGLAAGLGSLSKYTMLFIWPSLFLYIVLSKRDRHWLRRKEPYLSLLLCAIVFSLVLVWNAQRDWVSFRHLMGQAKVQEGFRISLKSFIEFVGSQIGVATPFFFVAIIYGLWVGLRDGLRKQRQEYLYLFCCGAVTLVSYLLKSLQGEAQANWAASAYVPGAVLAVGILHERVASGAWAGKRKTLRWLSISGYSLALAVVLLAHSFALLRQAGIRIPYRRDPTARAIGWKELGEKVGNVYLPMSRKHPTFIFSDAYQITSELAFYVEGRPQTLNVNLGRRLNQYDFWKGFDERLGWDAVFVNGSDAPLPAGVQQAFDRSERESVVQIERFSLPVKTFSVFRCYGFRGFKEGVRRVTY